ncbi:MAG: winged helix-turn-helix transcriptional regulator [Thermoplasmata archaeon]|nr:winged helix-turn-helix transcriptional regulator [Thermoplasmata archaeon]
MQENYTFLDDLGEELDLLQRHIKILQLLKKDGPLGILRISQITNIPQHRVRYSLRILETEGMITASPEGAKIVGNVDDFVKKLKNGLSEIEKRISELREDLDSF